MFSPPIDSPIVSPVTGPWGHGQSGVPGDPIALFWERDGFEDSIGLSAAALWAALPAEHRSIYFSDPEDDETMLDAETIITNIEASEYLNDGGELVGNETDGYAQYEDGTTESVLRKAYRYFGVTYPLQDQVIIDSQPMLIDGQSMYIGV